MDYELCFSACLVFHPSSCNPKTYVVCTPQARATLEASLTVQVDSLRTSIARVRQQVLAADEVLAGMALALAAVEGDSAESAARPLVGEGGASGTGVGIPAAFVGGALKAMEVDV